MRSISSLLVRERFPLIDPAIVSAFLPVDAFTEAWVKLPDLGENGLVILVRDGFVSIASGFCGMHLLKEGGNLWIIVGLRPHLEVMVFRSRARLAWRRRQRLGCHRLDDRCRRRG